jgi:hypothetical protein
MPLLVQSNKRSRDLTGRHNTGDQKGSGNQDGRGGEEMGGGLQEGNRDQMAGICIGNTNRCKSGHSSAVPYTGCVDTGTSWWAWEDRKRDIPARFVERLTQCLSKGVIICGGEGTELQCTLLVHKTH